MQDIRQFTMSYQPARKAGAIGKHALVCMAASVLLIACSGTPVKRHYLLELSDAVSTPMPHDLPPPAVSVAVPVYLDEDRMVLQTAPNELNQANYHRWAEPLRAGIARVLQLALQRELVLAQASDLMQSASVTVRRFHGNSDAQVVLLADWTASTRCGKQRGQYGAELEQSGDGYAAMAATQSLLLERMAQAMVAQMKTRCAQPS